MERRGRQGRRGGWGRAGTRVWPASVREVRARLPGCFPHGAPGFRGRGRRQVWTDAQVWFSSAQQVTPRDALPRPPRAPHPAPRTLRPAPRALHTPCTTAGEPAAADPPVGGAFPGRRPSLVSRSRGPPRARRQALGDVPAACPVASATRALAAWSWTRSVRAGGARRRPHYVGRGHLKQIAKASQPRVWASVTGQSSECRR